MQVLISAPRPSPHRYAGPYEDDPSAPGPHLVAIDATQYETRPGPITGIDSCERSAYRPESLTVSMQTAS